MSDLQEPPGTGRLIALLHPRAARQTLRALRHRNYRLYFFGQLTSLIGTWMQNLAQGWLVWRLSHSPWLLGLVSFFQMIPVLLLGLIGGVVADRYDRHKVLIATQAAALVQSALLAALTLAGQIAIWEILALAALLGIINAIDMPVRQAFVVHMVGREDLGNAIALNSSVFNGARVVGPALAGLVLSRWGEGICFGLNALSFLAVLASLFAMRLAKPALAEVSGSAWTHLMEGFTYIRETPHVRALLLLVTATGFFAFPYASFLPAFAGGILKRDASGLGILMTWGGLGALAGALTLARREGVRGLGRLVGNTAIGLGLALSVFGFSRSFTLSCAILCLAGFFMISELAAANTLLQVLVPEEFRGRLMSLYVITFQGVSPVGSLVLGRVAHHFGVQAVVVAGGALTFIAGLVFRLYLPKIRRSVLHILQKEPTSPL